MENDVTDFSKPFVVNSNPFGSFGRDFEKLVPRLEDIPEDFDNKRKWEEWQSEWFFSGLTPTPTPRPGIDVDLALRHLAAIQRSWEPKHEHKQIYVAYLASLWFEHP
jgi:hypothetical protein